MRLEVSHWFGTHWSGLSIDAMTRRIAILALLGLGLSAHAAQRTSVEPLTLETYIKLTLVRLQLIKTRWQWQREAPTPDDLNSLWAKHKTTEWAYLRFGAANRVEIEEYLARNSEVRLRIEKLSGDIKKFINKVGDAHEGR